MTYAMTGILHCADAMIRELLDDPQVAYTDAHNAAHGCFSARIERHD